MVARFRRARGMSPLLFPEVSIATPSLGVSLALRPRVSVSHPGASKYAMSYTRAPNANLCAENIARAPTKLGGQRGAKRRTGGMFRALLDLHRSPHRITHHKIRKLPKRATDRAPNARSAPLPKPQVETQGGRGRTRVRAAGGAFITTLPKLIDHWFKLLDGPPVRSHSLDHALAFTLTPQTSKKRNKTR